MDANEEKIAVARLSVYSNSTLVVLKLAVGTVMGSVAVISEAIHSGLDLVAALIAKYSVKRSAEPADKEHRFGHGKFENLSGMIEGILILVAATWIMYEATRRLIGMSEVQMLEAGMAVMAVSAVLNFIVSKKLMRVAKKTESLALEADAYHLTTDVWTSLGVFVALGLIEVTGFRLLDPAIAIVVAAFIVRAALDITRRSTEGLLDKSLPESEHKAIERIMDEHNDEFLNYHDLRTRKAGSERHIDLHIAVPKNWSVQEADQLAKHLESDIKTKLPRSVVMIRSEPCDFKCDECKLESTKPECARKLSRQDC
jgi:cation diffusion facilitator family transporter